MEKKMQLKSNGWHDVILNGDLLTGDTYACKEFIKNRLNGKYDAQSKGWIVDLDSVIKYTTEAGTLMAK